MPPPRSSGSRPAYAFTSEITIDVPAFGACRRVDVWNAWRFAQADVELAFRAWSSAPTRDKRDAHVVYGAALDREHQAAAVLAGAMSGFAPERRVAAVARADLR